jgi:hypothetical protein
MLALRYAALLAITVWVGGLIALGAVAAPAIFDVVAARQLPDGRLFAGTVFGEILRRFHNVSYVCGGVILLSLTARAALGPRPRQSAMRLALTLAMLGAVVYSAFFVAPRIERLQRMTGVAPSSLPAGDPRRAEFGRLHGLSTGVQLVPLVGGLILLFFEMRD